MKGNTMTKKTNWVTPYFEEETLFEVPPTDLAPYRATSEAEFAWLKERLISQMLEARPAPELEAPLRRAANEAAGLAWTTSFPTLFFPILLEEAAIKTARQMVKQREIRWASPRFMEKEAA
jgi:hypothetical protein